MGMSYFTLQTYCVRKVLPKLLVQRNRILVEMQIVLRPSVKRLKSTFSGLSLGGDKVFYIEIGGVKIYAILRNRLLYCLFKRSNSSR